MIHFLPVRELAVTVECGNCQQTVTLDVRPYTESDVRCMSCTARLKASLTPAPSRGYLLVTLTEYGDDEH